MSVIGKKNFETVVCTDYEECRGILVIISPYVEWQIAPYSPQLYTNFDKRIFSTKSIELQHMLDLQKQIIC